MFPNSDNYADTWRGGPHDHYWTEPEEEPIHTPGCQCKQCIAEAEAELDRIAPFIKPTSHRKAKRFAEKFIAKV